MYLDDAKTTELRELIAKLYTRPFDEALAFESCREACDLVRAQYYAVYLFPYRKRSRPTILSNNPPDFLATYYSVMDKDFLMGCLVDAAGDYILRRDPEYDIEGHADFITAVQDARPISDMAYLPLKTEGELRGYLAFGRAGRAPQDSAYSDDEIATLRFVTGFINDAFARSLVPPPLEGDLAYLDRRGSVLAAGDTIRAAFDELFGPNRVCGASNRGEQPLVTFRAAYRAFLRGPFRVGMDQIVLGEPGRRRRFAFCVLRPAGLPIEGPDLPFASVRLLATEVEPRASRADDRFDLGRRYSFSPREDAVIRGIYRGQSNKEIALTLAIDESTVKRYTHNIYEKTGYRSRVELVLGLHVE
jgi:DNA-binding CsgD family transcriptional regulator